MATWVRRFINIFQKTEWRENQQKFCNRKEKQIFKIIENFKITSKNVDLQENDTEIYVSKGGMKGLCPVFVLRESLLTKKKKAVTT